MGGGRPGGLWSSGPRSSVSLTQHFSKSASCFRRNLTPVTAVRMWAVREPSLQANRSRIRSSFRVQSSPKASSPRVPPGEGRLGTLRRPSASVALLQDRPLACGSWMGTLPSAPSRASRSCPAPPHSSRPTPPGSSQPPAGCAAIAEGPCSIPPKHYKKLAAYLQQCYANKSIACWRKSREALYEFGSQVSRSLCDGAESAGGADDGHLLAAAQGQDSLSWHAGGRSGGERNHGAALASGCRGSGAGHPSVHKLSRW